MVIFASEVGALLGNKGGFGLTWLEAFARFLKRNLPRDAWRADMEARQQRMEGEAMTHVRKTLTHDLDAPLDGAALAKAKRQCVQDVRSEAENAGATLEVVRAAERVVTSEMNAQFGAAQEGGGLDRLQARDTIAVTDRNEKTMYGPWYCLKAVGGGREARWRVGGRVDGVREDHIVEMKQRVGRLFQHLPSYEYAQTQSYMHVLEAQTTDERLRRAAGRTCVVQQQLLRDDEVRQQTCWVNADTAYWNGIVVPCLNWLCGCVLVLRHEPAARRAWSAATDEQREILLMTKIPKAFEIRYGSLLPVPDVAAQQVVPCVAFVDVLKIAAPQENGDDDDVPGASEAAATAQ